MHEERNEIREWIQQEKGNNPNKDNEENEYDGKKDVHLRVLGKDNPIFYFAVPLYFSYFRFFKIIR